MYKIQSWKLSVVLACSIACFIFASLGDYTFAQNSCIPDVTCPARIVNDPKHGGQPAGKLGNNGSMHEDVSAGKPGNNYSMHEAESAGRPSEKDQFPEKAFELRPIHQLQQKDLQRIQKFQQNGSATLEKLQKLTPRLVQQAEQIAAIPIF